MAVAFGIVVTTLLWGLLIVSSILNLKDRWRGKRLDIVIEDLKERHKTEVTYASVERLRQMSERMKASEYPLLMAGKLRLLAEEALWMSVQLNKIVGENKGDANPLDLSRPLVRELICIDPSESELVLPWQRLRLMSFRDRYRIHVKHLYDESVQSGLLKQTLPTELDSLALSKMIMDHNTELLARATELIAPYSEAKKGIAAHADRLLAEAEHSVTISPTDQTCGSESI